MEPVELTVLDDIPDDLAAGIGRVIFLSSVLEDKLKGLIYALLGLDQTLGRLAVREPRAPELFDMARELTAFHRLELNIPNEIMNKIRSDIELCNSRRDILAHAVLCRNEKTGLIHAIRTSGSWNPESKKDGRVRRAIDPEGVLIDATRCAALSSKIYDLVGFIDNLGVALNTWRRSSQ